MALIDLFRRKPKSVPFESDALKARMGWMNDALKTIPDDDKRALVANKLKPAIMAHVAASGETLSQESIVKATKALSDHTDLSSLSTAHICNIVDPKLSVADHHIRKAENIISAAAAKQRTVQIKRNATNVGHRLIDDHMNSTLDRLERKHPGKNIGAAIEENERIASTAKNNLEKFIASHPNPEKLTRMDLASKAREHFEAAKPKAPAAALPLKAPAVPTDQVALKAQLAAKHSADPVMKHREVLKKVGIDKNVKGGAVDSEVLRSANARTNVIKSNPKALKRNPKALQEIHALERDVVKHQHTHFGNLDAYQQKDRLDYLSHEHALPQAKKNLLNVKSGTFEFKEWTHEGIKGKFTQHADGTVLHHVKAGRPLLIAAGLEHEAHLAAATTTRMERMGSALKGGFGKTTRGIGSTVRGTKKAAAYAAPVLAGAADIGGKAAAGTKKAFGKGLKLTGWTAAIIGGVGALAWFSSRERNSRHIDNLPPPADDLEPLAPIPDFSGSRQVLGPHTARVLGLGGNAAIQPDMMGNDGASLVDGKPVGALGPSPN